MWSLKVITLTGWEILCLASNWTEHSGWMIAFDVLLQTHSEFVSLLQARAEGNSTQRNN